MRPVLALVGRPNVGKSTLFNRLTRSRDALVADLPGLTRDRQYGEGRIADRPFIVIDTGGLSGEEEGIDFEMASQSLLAIEEADCVLLLVDGRAGLTPGDTQIVNYLRKKDKNVCLVVNKVDGVDENIAMGDFYGLGIQRVYPVTASQGRGVRKLIDDVLATFPKDEELVAAPLKGIKIAISGRPNVGKSTLVNRMLGEDRVVVYDLPGTTRDSVYIPFERHGQHYTLIDTAGIRRRGKTTETVEKFSVVKSLQAIEDANVVILIIDARTGIVEQDLHLLGYVLDAGRALVIALNKWDGMDMEQKDKIKSDIRRRFAFVDFAKIHFISALHGTGVGDLYESIHGAFDAAQKTLTTSVLTQVLEAAVNEHAPPMVDGRRIKLRYAHAGGHNPPIIVIHGKQTDKIPDHYSRYLEKTFRQVLKLEGTPVRIQYRSDDNPYIRHEQDLTQQQVAQKRRIRKNRKTPKSSQS
ncbi:MAG: ribosome biogenesis GTPase Der [Gammaproteobacteria bacterium]|nr:ribosome biogenesis GTPase Der [Gammaproteobacteria bacterium]MDP2140618.1 ribosome biogenesis GTPase Der [Gammaproteobacteria bacterium]MDP2347390.1 ribosome biogenesis GTPase Der [Gammaproteobacteria bacterium]